MAELSGFLSEIYRRIDDPLTVDWRLLKFSRSQTVTLDGVIRPDGTLQKLKTRLGADFGLSTVVQRVVKTALSEPLPQPLRIQKSIPVTLAFHFDIYDVKPLHEMREDRIVQNQLRFFRSRAMEQLADLQTLNRGGGVVNVNVDAIYDRFFKKLEPEDQRVKWDITLKLNRSISACEKGAEGACLEAGRILEMSGDMPQAQKYFEKGCELGYELSCQKLMTPQVDSDPN